MKQLTDWDVKYQKLVSDVLGNVMSTYLLKLNLGDNCVLRLDSGFTPNLSIKNE